MNEFIKAKELLALTVEKYLDCDASILAELKDNIEELESLESEAAELSSHLDKLSSALRGGDKKACAESIAMARTSYMNVESAYSNMADIMSGITVGLMDSVRLEAAENIKSYELRKLLTANDQLELGTFMDELHYQLTFNEEKFSQIITLLSEADEGNNNIEIVQMAFRIYSRVMKKLYYHGSKDDGFVIKNVDAENISEIYDLLDKLEGVIQSILD